jgi:beta-N-acetylhexosaminidase
VELLPAIFGLEGTALTTREIALFRDISPAGYILFARNCESPSQLSHLSASLRALHVGYVPLILIDQEGGRVARLKEPHWVTPPAAGYYSELAAEIGLEAACEAAYGGAREIADTLLLHGITVNCAPMCDVRFPESHAIIGDRAYGMDSAQVIALARAVADGLLDGGVLPVIKHIPGHGRAVVDSHETLPIVAATRAELEEDFAPFAALSHLPLTMTAHILYTAIDPDLPATLSPKVMRVIREEIGFTNLIMSDDLCMKALRGTPSALARQTLNAGCDLVLHCNGDFDAMQEICDALDGHYSMDSARLPRIPT